MLKKKLLLGASIITLSFFTFDDVANAQNCDEVQPVQCKNYKGSLVALHHYTDGGLNIPASTRPICEAACIPPLPPPPTCSDGSTVPASGRSCCPTYEGGRDGAGWQTPSGCGGSSGGDSHTGQDRMDTDGDGLDDFSH